MSEENNKNKPNNKSNSTPYNAYNNHHEMPVEQEEGTIEEEDVGQESDTEQEDAVNAVKDSASLGKNIATGNVGGIAKDAIKLAKNKKVKKKIIIHTILNILVPILIIIIIGSSVLGIFNAVAKGIQDFIDGVVDTVGGIVDGIIDFFTPDDDGAIVVSDGHVNQILTTIENMGVSAEDLHLLGDYSEEATKEEQQEAMNKYIKKFYEAQAVTETLNYSHKESTNSKTYGAIYVFRSNGDNDLSNDIKLTYEEYDKMLEWINDNNKEALNHFSIDEEDNMVYASTVQTIKETGSDINNLNEDSNETVLQEKKLDYKTAVSQYTTQMNFLIDLTMISQNPEFVSAVVDLIKDSRINLTIMDNVSTYKNTTTYKYRLNTTKREEVLDENGKVKYYRYTSSFEDKTEITRETVINTNSTPQITYVKTWFCEQELSYNFNKNQNNDSNEEWLENEKSPAGAGSWRTNQYIKNEYETINDIYEEGTSSGVRIILGKSGDGKRYKNGEISEQTFVGLMETEFRIPYSSRTSFAGHNLESGAQMLFLLLQQDANLQNMETLMRYALYLYSGDNYGVTSIDGSIYEIGDFVTISSISSTSLLVEYIRHFEHSTEPPTNSDGTKYIIEEGAAGEPVVGYGVDIQSHINSFIQAGQPTTIGEEVDKKFVDSLEEQIRLQMYEDVKNMTEGLNLTEYQLHALTSRAYNCGVKGALVNNYVSGQSMNFVESYNAYWNQDIDDQFEEQNNNANFDHRLYTNFMQAPVTADGEYLPGLETRRKSEWILFQTGYYNVLGEWYKDSGAILEMADKLHQAQTSWNYSVGGDLYWNNIELSINNPNKVTCCATYVSSVLYLSGHFSEEQMNSFNYNSSNGLYNFLLSNGWQAITEYSALQAGDVVFMDTDGGARAINHVQLYAGDGTWYNAGSNDAIHSSAPYSSNASNEFMIALRQK